MYSFHGHVFLMGNNEVSRKIDEKRKHQLDDTYKDVDVKSHHLINSHDLHVCIVRAYFHLTLNVALHDNFIHSHE